MTTSTLVHLIDMTAGALAEAEMPLDPFERQAIGTVALDLAGDLIAFVQRLQADRGPYVTTYSVEERLAHRRAALEPPKDRPEPQPDPDPPPDPAEPAPQPPAEAE